MFLNVELPQPKAPQISKTFCRSSLGSQPSSSSSVSHLCGVFLSAVRVPRLCQVTLGAGAARGVWSPVPTICVRWCVSATQRVGIVHTRTQSGGAKTLPPRSCQVPREQPAPDPFGHALQSHQTHPWAPINALQ